MLWKLVGNWQQSRTVDISETAQTKKPPQYYTERGSQNISSSLHKKGKLTLWARATIRVQVSQETPNEWSILYLPYNDTVDIIGFVQWYGRYCIVRPMTQSILYRMFNERLTVYRTSNDTVNTVTYVQWTIDSVSHVQWHSQYCIVCSMNDRQCIARPMNGRCGWCTCKDRRKIMISNSHDIFVKVWYYIRNIREICYISLYVADRWC